MSVTNKTLVPAELEPSIESGRLALVDYIYDSESGKTLKEINEEVSNLLSSIPETIDSAFEEISERIEGIAETSYEVVDINEQSDFTGTSFDGYYTISYSGTLYDDISDIWNGGKIPVLKVLLYNHTAGFSIPLYKAPNNSFNGHDRASGNYTVDVTIDSSTQRIYIRSIGTYNKPNSGIPREDLSLELRGTLNSFKATSEIYDIRVDLETNNWYEFAVGTGNESKNSERFPELGDYRGAGKRTIFTVGTGRFPNIKKNALEVRLNGDVYFNDIIKMDTEGKITIPALDGTSGNINLQEFILWTQAQIGALSNSLESGNTYERPSEMSPILTSYSFTYGDRYNQSITSSEVNLYTFPSPQRFVLNGLFLGDNAQDWSAIIDDSNIVYHADSIDEKVIWEDEEFLEYFEQECKISIYYKNSLMEEFYLTDSNAGDDDDDNGSSDDDDPSGDNGSTGSEESNN